MLADGVPFANATRRSNSAPAESRSRAKVSSEDSSRQQ